MKFQVFSYVALILTLATFANADASDNYEVFSNVGTGCLCLDQSTTAKNQLIMSECDSTAGSTQLIGGSSNINFFTGYNTLQFQVGQWFLEVWAYTNPVGTEVLQWPENSQANQLWSFVPVGNFVQVVSNSSALCLAVNLNSLGGQPTIIQDTCKSWNNLQLWDFGNKKCGT